MDSEKKWSSKHQRIWTIALIITAILAALYGGAQTALHPDKSINTAPTIPGYFILHAIFINAGVAAIIWALFSGTFGRNKPRGVPVAFISILVAMTIATLSVQAWYVFGLDSTERNAGEKKQAIAVAGCDKFTPIYFAMTDGFDKSFAAENWGECRYLGNPPNSPDTEALYCSQDIGDKNSFRSEWDGLSSEFQSCFEQKGFKRDYTDQKPISVLMSGGGQIGQKTVSGLIELYIAHDSKTGSDVLAITVLRKEE